MHLNESVGARPSVVFLAAGATPGMHFPESRFYIRRIRLARSSGLVPVLREAGVLVEVRVKSSADISSVLCRWHCANSPVLFERQPAVGSEESTVVASFPIDCGEGVRTLDEVLHNC